MSEKIDYSKGIYDARQLGTGRMLILGVQHMFAMFGATVLVPLLTGLSVSTTLLCAGLGTLLFHLVTRGKVPAFLGSSFAYLGGFSIVAPMLADANGNLTVANTKMLPYACAGVAFSGILYLVVSLLISTFGIRRIMKFFPPVVTGPIIISIGLILAPSAITNCESNWLLAFVALGTVIVCNIWGKGMVKILPILIGVLVSYAVALVTGAVDFQAIAAADWFGIPLHQNAMGLFAIDGSPEFISALFTFFGGIGGASRNGILIKGSNYMDALAKVGTVVFDKTGTLTHGEFAVAAVHADDSCPDHSSHDADNIHIGEYSDKEKILLHLAAHAEHFTTHPIGAALRTAFPQEATDGCEVTDVEEIAGQGIRAKVNGKVVCVGNKKMMESIGAQWHDCNQVGTIIHVAIDGKYAGHIVINDTLKGGSAHAIRELKELGVEKTVMLTGDRREVGEDVAHKLGLDECRAELLPTDKVSHVEQLLKTKPTGKTLAYVGDGINDAPVLKRADVGIAMGGLGSDAAIEAADVVLMDDDPRKIALAVNIARRTIHIAHENVIFAIGVKVAVLILATIGLGTMWMAVFADVGVTVLAVLNAMRSLGKNRLFYR